MSKLFAVFDTETTGLPLHENADVNLQPKIIEFGGVLTDGIEILDRCNFICNPIVKGKTVELSPVITKITGLTNDDLDGEPIFEFYIPTIKKFFSKADVVIAHNLSFDKAMVLYEMRRLGKELEDVSFPSIEICTVEQCVKQFGYRRKLIDLYNMYCEEAVQSHRAEDDVMMLHEICKAMGIYNLFD
jgi:DNA polymerase III epsilon subunit-like protein